MTRTNILRQNNDQIQITQIKNGNKIEFANLFHQYYAPLCSFAYQYLHDSDECEEVVQGFFSKFWEKRKQIEINSSINSYFFGSIKNLCINRIKHQKIKSDYVDHVKTNQHQPDNTDKYFIEVGLKEKIDHFINELPEKRREIFLLSREKGMKYKEIADQLNISVKTVETQMGFALKTLREQLKDYKELLISFLFIRMLKGKKPQACHTNRKKRF